MAAGHEHVAMLHAALVQPVIGTIHGCGIAVFVGKHVKVRQAAANEHAAPNLLALQNASGNTILLRLVQLTKAPFRLTPLWV